MNLGRMDLRAGIVSLLGNRRGHAFALILFYVLLLVEYYRFVYGNYFFLMGFDFRFSPVAFLSGLLMLVAVVAMLDAVGSRSDRLYAMGVVVAAFLGHHTLVGTPLATHAPVARPLPVVAVAAAGFGNYGSFCGNVWFLVQPASVHPWTGHL